MNELPERNGGLQAIESALVKKMQQEQKEEYQNIYQMISQSNGVVPIEAQKVTVEQEHRREVNTENSSRADFNQFNANQTSTDK